MKKRLKAFSRTTIALLTAALVCSPFTKAYADDTVDSLEKQTNGLQNQLDSLNQDLTSLSAEITDLASKLRIRMLPYRKQNWILPPQNWTSSYSMML